VYRDIKPGNILVKHRYPLYIKFADFGLSKEGSSFTTICGSKTYVPPEIARYLSSPKSVPTEKYKSAVNIWSLGVIILEYAYGLPYPGRRTKLARGRTRTPHRLLVDCYVT
jgi:serine/threonine protein kinase